MQLEREAEITRLGLPARMPVVAHPLLAVILACLLRLHAAANTQRPGPAWPLAAQSDWPISRDQAVLPAVAPSSADAPAAGVASPLPALQPTMARRGDTAAPSALAPAPEQAEPAALQRRRLSEDTLFTQGMLPLDNRGQTVRALCTFDK